MQKYGNKATNGRASNNMISATVSHQGREQTERLRNQRQHASKPLPTSKGLVEVPKMNSYMTKAKAESKNKTP